MIMKKGITKRRGFTLIELLLVLVILAVLGAVVVPKFTKRSQQAKETAAATDINTIGLALDSFEIDTGRYPSNTEGIKALFDEPINTNNDWKGPYSRGSLGQGIYLPTARPVQ
jgi:general secretion pathway protein G